MHISSLAPQSATCMTTAQCIVRQQWMLNFVSTQFSVSWDAWLRFQHATHISNTWSRINAQRELS